MNSYLKLILQHPLEVTQLVDEHSRGWTTLVSVNLRGGTTQQLHPLTTGRQKIQVFWDVLQSWRVWPWRSKHTQSFKKLVSIYLKTQHNIPKTWIFSSTVVKTSNLTYRQTVKALSSCGWRYFVRWNHDLPHFCSSFQQFWQLLFKEVS